MKLETLSISDILRFRAIVTEIERLGNPAKDMQDVRKRLLTDASVAIANVSDFLKKLREKLECPALVESTPRIGRIQITEAGRRLNEFALDVEGAVKAAVDPAFKDRISIACGSLFAARILPQLLRRYLEEHSEFREIWLRERVSPIEVLQNVQNGAVDLGITLEIEWEGDHGLYQTELIRANRGIIVSEHYWHRNRGEITEKTLSDQVTISYHPEILRQAGMDKVFPSASDKGVRVYARSENTIIGWVQHGVAFGHTYDEPVLLPSDIRFVLKHRAAAFKQSCWCAYTRKDPLQPSDERERRIGRFIQAMLKEALELKDSGSSSAANEVESKKSDAKRRK